MTPEGYKKVHQALVDHGIEAEVSPVPKEGEDIRYVTIRGPEGQRLIGEKVLNALDAADVGENHGFSDNHRYENPELILKAQTESTITFHDTRANPN